MTVLNTSLHGRNSAGLGEQQPHIVRWGLQCISTPRIWIKLRNLTAFGTICANIQLQSFSFQSCVQTSYQGSSPGPRCGFCSQTLTFRYRGTPLLDWQAVPAPCRPDINECDDNSGDDDDDDYMMSQVDNDLSLRSVSSIEDMAAAPDTSSHLKYILRFH